MFDKLKLKIEVWHYARYAAMNAARKGAENNNRIFKALDAARRITGYVK